MPEQRIPNAELAAEYIDEARHHYRRHRYQEAESAALIARVYTERMTLDYLRERDAADQKQREEWRAEDLARIATDRAEGAEKSTDMLDTTLAYQRETALMVARVQVDRQHELQQQQWAELEAGIRENGDQG